MAFSDHQDAALSQDGFRVIFRVDGYAVAVFLFLAVASYSPAFCYIQISIYIKICFDQFLVMSGHRGVVRCYGDPELAEPDDTDRPRCSDIRSDLGEHTALLFRLYPG